MIVWADGSQPAMRRAVRGHSAVFDGVEFFQPKPGPFSHPEWTARAHCSTCKTAWINRISQKTRQALMSPSPRKAVAEVVALGFSRLPTCEEAYRELVAREIIES